MVGLASSCLVLPLLVLSSLFLSSLSGGIKNAPSRARTYDPGVISTMLYRLSYRSSQKGGKKRVYVLGRQVGVSQCRSWYKVKVRCLVYLIYQGISSVIGGCMGTVKKSED